VADLSNRRAIGASESKDFMPLKEPLTCFTHDYNLLGVVSSYSDISLRLLVRRTCYFWRMLWHITRAVDQ